MNDIIDNLNIMDLYLYSFILILCPTETYLKFCISYIVIRCPWDISENLCPVILIQGSTPVTLVWGSTVNMEETAFNVMPRVTGPWGLKQSGHTHPGRC